MKMIDLYEQHKSAWDKIARDGMPEIADLAKHFKTCSDMDRAFGYTGAVRKWVNGRNPPSNASYIAAKALLENITKQAELDLATEMASAPSLFLTGNPKSLQKVQAIAKMLGCEVVEV
jgi:predicted glycosyltransferase